jgi:hypothetical protein
MWTQQPNLAGDQYQADSNRQTPLDIRLECIPLLRKNPDMLLRSECWCADVLWDSYAVRGITLSLRGGDWPVPGAGGWWFADHQVGCPFGHHDCGGAGPPPNQVRHRRGVDYPQAANAVHTEILIDHGSLV